MKFRSMRLTMLLVFCSMLALLTSPTIAQTAAVPPSLSPSPAPAPAPSFVNLTALLTYAGPFDIFLNYCTQTHVLETFQNQANNTLEHGITIFVPTDLAFSSLKKPSLSNLTQDQLKSLFLFHAIPKYCPLADFKNLSSSNPVSTFAGGEYKVNITDASGLDHVSSGWTDAKITSSVHSTDPVAVYEVNHVLLPEAIFGAAPPPAPAPAPSPDLTPPSDLAPSGNGSALKPSDSSSNHSSSYNINAGVMNYLAFAVSGVLMLML